MAIFRTVVTEVYCDICGMPVIGWKSEGTGVSRKMAAYYARKEGCTTGKKIICKSCRINRRIEKCSLQKKCGSAGRDGSGAAVWFVDREKDGLELEPCEMEYRHSGMAIRRLAEYEDLEEQGRLLKLPCAVGDTVWQVQVISGGGRVPDKGEIHESIFRVSMYEEIGKTIFLTMEEAEAAIKGADKCFWGR